MHFVLNMYMQKNNPAIRVKTEAEYSSENKDSFWVFFTEPNKHLFGPYSFFSVHGCKLDSTHTPDSNYMIDGHFSNLYSAMKTAFQDISSAPENPFTLDSVSVQSFIEDGYSSES